MKTVEKTFGFLPNGKEVKLFTLETPMGLSISVTNYGGAITSIRMPDRNNKMEEIVAGFPTIEGYLKNHPHFGVIVGRYANRIEHGQFEISGEKYQLPINNGLNHLHGGDNGFHTKLWKYDFNECSEHAILKLTYCSAHLEEGYPGNLKATVTYTVSCNNELKIEFTAETDRPTHVNLTSHGYFNLNGFKKSIYDHELSVNAQSYLDVDKSLIPNGNFINCKSSPLDFTSPRKVGETLAILKDGLDHCFVLNPTRTEDTPAAILSDNTSGRQIKLFCSHPGLQVYTGNWLDGSLTGHNGVRYNKHSAICLEMQHFPNSPNIKNFPSTLLEPHMVYRQNARIVFEIM